MQIEVVEDINQVPAADWDALVGNDPFSHHAFYLALENSGSVGEGTGWQPLHLAAYSNGVLAGAMPLYAKSHSYGEYVFDHAFADAYERAGGQYYPKLLAAAPFTPANGQRVFGDHDIQNEILDAALKLSAQNGLSSTHVNFCLDFPKRDDFLERHSVQYHFHNPGYADFDDFLAALRSPKRKALRKERRALNNCGLTITRKLGADILPSDWDCFWNCYQDTGARKWGTPYLRRAFFDEIAQSMQGNIMMVLAYDDGHAVAAAINFYTAERLLGRYWGTQVDVKFLHFELCYYQAIEFAIEQKIPLIEAGAQGEHKMQRGYEPVITRSHHQFTHPEFQNVIARFLRQEQRDLKNYVDYAQGTLPYRKDETCVS